MATFRLWPVAALLFASAAAGQPTALTVRHLTPADGLSGVTVAALAPEAGGFVWVGLPSGPDLYDGARVRPIGVSLPGPLRALATGPEGALWLGTDSGLARWDAGDPPLSIRDLGAAVSALLPDGAGIWAGTQGAGLVRLGSRGGRRHRRVTGHLASDTVRALAAVPGGAVVAATTGGLSRVAPGQRPRHARALRDVTTLAASGDALWAGRADGTLVPFDPTALVPDGPVLDVGAGVSVLEPSAVYPGWAWVGTRGGGLFLLDARGASAHAVTLTRVRDGDPIARPEILSVLESRGSLWIGTTDGVLHADVTPPRFETIAADPTRPDGLRTPEVMSVYASRRDPGTVWVGTVRGGLHRYDRETGQAEAWFGDPTHSLSVPFAIREASDGALWLGGLRTTLYRFEPGVPLDSIPLAADPRSYITSIVPARGGGLWVTTSASGVFRVEPAARRVTSLPDIMPEAGPVAVYQVVEPTDEPGVLYATTYGAGLVRVDVEAGRTERVQPQGCVLDDKLIGLAVGPDGALWVGSDENRLARIDRQTETCRAWGPADGVPNGSVGGILLDARGRVWTSTMAGLAVFDPKAEVFTRFSAADGLPEGALYFHAHDQTPAGEVLVGGAAGFAAFDPLAVAIDSAGAPVRLTRVLVDGEPVPLAEARGGLRLRHNRNDLAVEYAALDLRQPEKTRYRVQLVGLDEDAATTDRADVRYASLPPGRYTLRIAATNRDGYWSEPTELGVRILPPVWLRPWFWLLVAGLVGAVGLAAHRYRVAQLLRVERTRRRIADDLHDDIGSKISSVALRLEAAQRSPALPPDERDRLARLGDTTRAVVGDLRDTVWLVDAGHDDLSSVADRMEQFARHTLEGGRGAVERGPVPKAPLGMEARRDLYLLFTEALHNAVRHAEAGHVAVRIGCDDGAFRVEVRDDGCGFDPSEASAGRGMSTMRRRADALGATLGIESAAGEGTVVHLRLPLRSRSSRYRANG
ncbi:sensor histidine kinase [Rubrivirga marina]|uniref:histidine kinase n=1 Tax=Rubrivirga marina TaxID=1196024 RepID=A0A271IXN4_9BACT|nr:sensor histidine kinase [Rubrivirga marina]PAP75475.1 hypothetical protein BSZ37_02945 [Rubrivirga marina]